MHIRTHRHTCSPKDLLKGNFNQSAKGGSHGYKENTRIDSEESKGMGRCRRRRHEDEATSNRTLQAHDFEERRFLSRQTVVTVSRQTHREAEGFTEGSRHFHEAKGFSEDKGKAFVNSGCRRSRT